MLRIFDQLVGCSSRINATFGNVIFLGTPLIATAFAQQGLSLILATIGCTRACSYRCPSRCSASAPRRRRSAPTWRSCARRCSRRRAANLCRRRFDGRYRRSAVERCGGHRRNADRLNRLPPGTADHRLGRGLCQHRGPRHRCIGADDHAAGELVHVSRYRTRFRERSGLRLRQPPPKRIRAPHPASLSAVTRGGSYRSQRGAAIS